MAHHAHAQQAGLAVRRRRSAGVPSLGLRIRVWARSTELDLRLAEGVRPASSPELELRAAQLSSTRSRRALSRGLTTAVDDASRRRGPWAPAVPIDRSGVLEAAGPLVWLARDLWTADDPPVRAVALASFLLCDGIASPLYNPRSAVTVRRAVRILGVTTQSGWNASAETRRPASYSPEDHGLARRAVARRWIRRGARRAPRGRRSV